MCERERVYATESSHLSAQANFRASTITLDRGQDD